MLQNDLMSKESLLAFEDLYLTSFDEINSPDELINLFLSTDYNHLKHWWMDWRNKVNSNFYKNSINIFPFHDREFQESTMSYSLKVRIGGTRNIFNMPNSYKNLFFSLFDKRIPISSIKRGNYAALPEYFSLFKTEYFYNFLNGELNKPQNAILFIIQNMIGDKIEIKDELSIEKKIMKFMEYDPYENIFNIKLFKRPQYALYSEFF